MNGCSEDSPSLMHRLLVVFCSAAAVAVSGVTLVSPASAQSFSVNGTPDLSSPPPFIPVPIVSTPVPTPIHLLTFNGTDYNVRVETGSFSGQLAADVESSPWWNSSADAQTVASFAGLSFGAGYGSGSLVAYSQEEVVVPSVPCFGGPGTCDPSPPFAFAGVLSWQPDGRCFLFSCGTYLVQRTTDVASENNYLVASSDAAVPEPSEILGWGVAAGWLGTVALKRKLAPIKA